MPSVNPVLGRELKERMRTRRTGFVLTAYLGVLTLVLYGLYTAANRRPFADPLTTANVGRSMFESLLLAVLLLVCFLVPGYTAGAIVGEKERQTLIPMQVTLLSARSIVIGKLLASLAYLVLLIVATVPLLATAFFFGGVTVAEMAKGIAMVTVIGVLLASLSLAVSAMARRAQTASVLAYGLTLLLVLGTFAFYGFENAIARHPGAHNKAVLVLNPLVATAEVVADHATDTGAVSSPLTGLRRLLHEPPAFDGVSGPNGGGIIQTIPANGFGVAVTGGAVTGPQVPLRASRPAPYVAYSLGCFALLTLGSLALAVRRLTTPAASDRT